MLTPASNQTAKLRIVPHFGDVAMIVGLMHSKIWLAIFWSK